MVRFSPTRALDILILLAQQRRFLQALEVFLILALLEAATICLPRGQRFLSNVSDMQVNGG